MSLFSDKYKTHKYSVGRTYSSWMLNCWCITWSVGFKRLIWPTCNFVFPATTSISTGRLARTDRNFLRSVQGSRNWSDRQCIDISTFSPAFFAYTSSCKMASTAGFQFSPGNQSELGFSWISLFVLPMLSRCTWTQVRTVPLTIQHSKASRLSLHYSKVCET